MKNKVLKVLVLIATLLIVLVVLFGYFVINKGKKKELFRENSPNGDYVLCISELGTPDWPFGKDHLYIMFYEKDNVANYRISFSADVANDGIQAGYQVEWIDEGVLIVLKGSEQPNAYYILPFKETVE